MAQLSKTLNVYSTSTTGDTLGGTSGPPVSIKTIVVKATGASASCQLAYGSTTVFDSGTVANGASQTFYDLGLYVAQGKSLTITLNNATAYFYEHKLT